MNRLFSIIWFFYSICEIKYFQLYLYKMTESLYYLRNECIIFDMKFDTLIFSLFLPFFCENKLKSLIVVHYHQENVI